MNLKRTAASILTLSLILQPALLSGCGKAKDRPKEVISEDTPWYEATVTTVDTGLDPLDYFYLYTMEVGMAGELIIYNTFGSEYYNLNDMSASGKSINILNVYDISGEHLYDTDVEDIIRDYCPGAQEIMIHSISVENGLVKICAGYTDDMVYKYQYIMYDPSARQSDNAYDITVNGDYEIYDSMSNGSWTADGYSIRSYYVFTTEGDDNYLDFTSPSGDTVTIRLEDTYPFDDIFTVYGFLYMGDGRFIFKFDNYEMDQRYFYIDLNSGTAADIEDVSEFSWITDIPDIWDYSYFDGVGNIVMSQEGINILNIDTKSEELYLSFDNCNINRFDASNMRLLYASEDRIVLGGTSERESFNVMSIHDIHELTTLIVTLQKADTNPNAGKALIRAAAISPLSYGMAESIRLYNDSSANAYIVLDPRYDYDTVSQTAIVDASLDKETFRLQVQAAMINTLSMDLMAGSGPDLILGTMNYMQFNRDDLLLDLAGEVDIPNVYDNIMGFAMTGDKLYQVPLAFGLQGILADRNNVESGEIGFTYDNYRDYVRNSCHGKDPNGMNRLDFMMTCLAQEGSSFRTENSLNYNNPEFAAAASFVNDLILPEDEELLQDEMLLNSSTFAEEPAYVDIVSGMELLRITQNDIVNKVIMGFPSSEPRGLMVDVFQSVAVSASTSCPEACKEYVRTLVGDDIQALFARYDGISVNSAAQAQACRIFAERANASFEVMSQYWDKYLINQLKQSVTTCDPEELVQQMDRYIRSASGLIVIDRSVEIIIREEIQAYFAGQKTIEVVMDVIQTRVDLYMSERG